MLLSNQFNSSLDVIHSGSPIQEITYKPYQERSITVSVKRDDLIHPTLSGNKFRKLKYLLRDAHIKQADTLVTFGGAYSNHLLATAYAGALYGFKTVGFVRGQELTHNSNSYLATCAHQGMELIFVDRTQYRSKEILFQEYGTHHQNAYYIPEGGSHFLAAQGVAELIIELPRVYDYIIVPAGTACTYAGLVNGIEHQGLHTSVLGIAVLHTASYLQEEAKHYSHFLNNHQNKHTIMSGYEQGGYARTTPALLTFINDFSLHHQIPLEPVYSGKMFFALHNLIMTGRIPEGKKVLAIHTGGIYQAI